MDNSHLGVVHTHNKSDYLFRVSLKALILDKDGAILVVKEAGRDWWDLPGGGMNQGESIKDALARELREEVSLKSDFDFEVVNVEEPQLLKRIKVYQLQIIFIVRPEEMIFAPGEEGDEVTFMTPEYFANSDEEVNQEIYRCWKLARERQLL